ncbi:hypothetical protein ACFX19_005005 [Malus domestica]
MAEAQSQTPQTISRFLLLARCELPPPNPESKSLRMSHKISMEYVGIQPTASQKPPRRPESGAPGSGSEWPSDSLALTDIIYSKEMQMGGAQNALVIGPSAPRAQ